MGPSLALHFPPPHPSLHPQLIMTRVWTLDSRQAAEKQQGVLEAIRNTQKGSHCRIVCLHSESIESDRCYKVVAGFEYPTRSLRQELIARRKKGRFPQYFTEKQLESILRLAGWLLTDCHNYLCNHSDLWSNLFIHEGEFKACHPELFPMACSQVGCSGQHFSQKARDLLGELLLLEKTVRAGEREKGQMKYLYSHSMWLNKLIDRMFVEKCDLRAVLGELERKGGQEDRYMETLMFSDMARFTSSIEKSPQTIRGSGVEVKEFKLAEETRASNSNRIRYYSDLTEFQGERPRVEKKEMLLDRYQKELAESIGEHEDSSIVSPRLYDMVPNQHDEILHLHEDIEETNSYLTVEVLRTEEAEAERGRDLQGNGLLFQRPSSKRRTRPIRRSPNTLRNSLEQDGYRYEGQLAKGKKHGKGVFIYPNGVYYEGDWVFDEMDGIGSLFYPSGRPYYRGEWKQGTFHGRGIFYNEEAESVLGEFDFRDFSQIGKKWRVFEGSFKRDMKDGQGVLTLSNGEFLQGEWREDVVEGRGSFHKLNNEIVRGIWIQNVLYLEQCSEGRN